MPVTSDPTTTPASTSFSVIKYSRRHAGMTGHPLDLKFLFAVQVHMMNHVLQHRIETRFFCGHSFADRLPQFQPADLQRN
jgi:hypothetical protein